MVFPLIDRVTYYASQIRYWLIWRSKDVLSLKTKLLNKFANCSQFFNEVMKAEKAAFFVFDLNGF